MEQKNLYLFSVENAIEIILIFNEYGEIVYANREAEEQLEYKGELRRFSVTDVFPGIFRMENGRVCIDEADMGTVKEMTAYRKNQTCFPVRMKVFRFDGEENSEQGNVQTQNSCSYICMVYNATKDYFLEKMASQAGQEAEAALKVKSEFVANVTHELRTPVNGILGNVQEIIAQETDKKKLELLDMVERSCRNMHALINNILDFSKLEAGKFVLEPREFQFRKMIDYVKGNHSNRIIEKGLDFTISISDEVPDCIVGDELRIIQVLNNLLSNAYKFTSVGAIHLEVLKTAQSGNRMELFFMVADSGIGIAVADQDKLFKSFSQVDASISRKYGGTGLGLNITKQLVELMGGRIHVQSDLGKGTTFSFDIWVELPENYVQEAGQQAQEQAEDAGQALLHKLQNPAENIISEKLWVFGEAENLEELEKKMSKLILSVEMENWEKAEMFAETVKQLVEGAPQEVRSAALRLKMAVQKGNYEKTLEAYEKMQGLL